MKKLFLISITFLLLQSCSSKDSGSNSGTTNVPTTVSDTDGNSYQTVAICNQIWMKSNLNVIHYRNGDIIPQVTDPIQWARLTTGAWCYYQNITANGTYFGKLYNWYAVNDSRGIAPSGWHIPSENEALSMINCLGGWQIAGGKMKSTANATWAYPNLGANNSSGFNAVTGGVLDSTMPTSSNPSSSFSTSGFTANWWTTTNDGTYSVCFTNNYNLTTCYTFGTSPRSGFSVRCIKD